MQEIRPKSVISRLLPVQTVFYFLHSRRETARRTGYMHSSRCPPTGWYGDGLSRTGMRSGFFPPSLKNVSYRKECVT